MKFDGTTVVSSDDAIAFDDAVADHQRGTLVPFLAIEDARTRERDAIGHSVSVTFLRCGGWSGL